MERKINAAAFKARCLALIDEVAESGEPITVTKRGKAPCFRDPRSATRSCAYRAGGSSNCPVMLHHSRSSSSGPTMLGQLVKRRRRRSRKRIRMVREAGHARCPGGSRAG